MNVSERILREELLLELERLKKEYKKHPFFKTQDEIKCIESQLKELEEK
jgi:hypothetical protein